MSHLTLETLARIADGPATEDEAAHLAACADCRAELDALRAQVAALRSWTPSPAPASVWRGVETRLGAERAEASGRTRRRGASSTWLLRAAAAATLFLAGTLAGARLGDGAPQAGDGPAGKTAVPAADPEGMLRDAESLYSAALARYMVERGASDPELDLVRRLAALESIILTAREALSETPDDVVIAGYYRTAVAQRQALMSQVQLTEGEVWF